MANILCFVALAGLSIGSANCFGWMTPQRDKANLDLKVEAVFHNGQVIQSLSYVNYVSTDSNGKLQSQVVQKILEKTDLRFNKYVEFLRRIPAINLSPSILASADKTTCLWKDDIKTGNLLSVWTPHKLEESYTGLLTKCGLGEVKTDVLVSPLQGKAWYLNSCVSGSPLVNSPRSSSTSLTKPPTPLYTIYVSTTNRIMMLNALVKFNVSSFIRGFSDDMMETENIIIPVTPCTVAEKENLKAAMRQMSFVDQEGALSRAFVFVKMPKAIASPVPEKTTLKTTMIPKNQVVHQASITTQPRGKMNLDLKVEAVFHDGKVIKSMSYVNYVSSDSNGVLRNQIVQKKIEKKDKYIDFLQRIPSIINLTPDILASYDKTCLWKDDIRVTRGNLLSVWSPHKMEESYTGLLTKCGLGEVKTDVLVSPLQGKAWYLNSCVSGSPLAKSPTPLYTIYVSTTDRIMMLNALVKFNVSSFVRRFPFDLMETENVVIPITSCTAGEKENLKAAMRQMSYVDQEGGFSRAIVFVKTSKGSASPAPEKVTLKTTMRSKNYAVQKPVLPVAKHRNPSKASAAVTGKSISHLSLLIGIVVTGMELLLGLSGRVLW